MTRCLPHDRRIAFAPPPLGQSRRACRLGSLVRCESPCAVIEVVSTQWLPCSAVLHSGACGLGSHSIWPTLANPISHSLTSGLSRLPDSRVFSSLMSRLAVFCGGRDRRVLKEVQPAIPFGGGSPLQPSAAERSSVPSSHSAARAC